MMEWQTSDQQRSRISERALSSENSRCAAVVRTGIHFQRGYLADFLSSSGGAL